MKGSAGHAFVDTVTARIARVTGTCLVSMYVLLLDMKHRLNGRSTAHRGLVLEEMGVSNGR